MLKKNITVFFWSFALAIALMTCRTYAAQAPSEQPQTETQTVLQGLQNVNGALYYYKDGSPVKNAWENVKNNETGKTDKYYFGADGKAYADKSRLINGKYYVFAADGKLCQGTDKHVVKVNGARYYVSKGGRAIKGWQVTPNYNVVYAYSSGKMAAKKKVSYIYFKSNGYAKNRYKALAKLEARKFINKHTKSSWSKRKKLNKCFWYLYKHRHYIAHFVKDHKASTTNGWQYKAAYDMLSSKRLIGNCRNFASSICAIARELGYRPVMYSMAKHSVVKAGGKWYDNMHGGLCAKGKRPYYNKVKKKFKY